MLLAPNNYCSKFYIFQLYDIQFGQPPVPTTTIHGVTIPDTPSHPPPGTAAAPWCVCGNCRDRHNLPEAKKCCSLQPAHCLSQSPVGNIHIVNNDFVTNDGTKHKSRKVSNYWAFV